jgi:regulatory protein
MIVTAACECSKARYKIFIDDEFAFVLYKGELRRYQVVVGEEMAADTRALIEGTVLPKRAKMRCLNLLKSRRYTEKQLTDKLQQGDYSARIITEAIEYVKGYGYVNDGEYARDYIISRRDTRTKQQIMNELWKKGIDKEVFVLKWNEVLSEDIEGGGIRAGMEGYMEEGIEEGSIEGGSIGGSWEGSIEALESEMQAKQILHLLEKRKYDKNSANLQEKRKMFAFLFRRGFTVQAINRFLSLDIT